MHYLGRLISIAISYSLLVAVAERAFKSLARLYISRLQHKTKKFHSIATPTVITVDCIRPLHDLDFRTVEPIKYRPFENRRHVAMGIRKTSMEEWIRIDKNYLDRITLRKQLLNDHPEICMGNSNISNPAIRELYEEILLDLLPKRYPSIFRISGDIFFNLVTGSRHRISAALADHAAMLRHLGENVEEDFVFMVPNPHSEFVLEGFVACFPQGFLPAAKLGMSVSEIHKPVPGYEGRLKKGVNRCFERMERGQSIGRLNWAIQCNRDTLCLPFDGANTLKKDDSPSLDTNVNPSVSFLRVEHHTLTCLPRTGTIVFAIRSYLTPLTQIRNEGLGPSLAEACESMPEKFGHYKNRPTWGQQVCAWLRAENTGYKESDHETLSTEEACPFLDEDQL